MFDADSAAEGIGGVVIQLISPAGEAVASAVSDVDGRYMLEYEHRGKPNMYTVVVEGYDDDGVWVLLKPSRRD